MPPKIAPWQIVILPLLRDDADNDATLSYCKALQKDLSLQSFEGKPLRVKMDDRDLSVSEKKWAWIKRGAPLILEIGPKDIAGQKVCITQRNKLDDGKSFEDKATFIDNTAQRLADIQKAMFEDALTFQKSRTRNDIKDWAAFEEHFKKTDKNGFADHQGFVRAKWCGDEKTLEKLDPLSVTIRCIPFDQDGQEGSCVLTGKPATQDVLFARTY